VILGPSLLGLFFPELQGAIFPKETRNVLYAGSTPEADTAIALFALDWK
jgi:hypothetical protein